MRMCSLESSVHGAHSRNTTPKSIHCSSSQALEEVFSVLRTIAFTVLTSTASRMAHAKTIPSFVLNRSMARLIPSSVFKESSLVSQGSDGYLGFFGPAYN